LAELKETPSVVLKAYRSAAQKARKRAERWDAQKDRSRAVQWEEMTAVNWAASKAAPWAEPRGCSSVVM